MPPRRQTAEPERMTPDEVMRMVNQKYPGAMTTGSDPGFAIEKIPTGILSIDVLLGGGFARNRHHELFGGYGVGKTYLTYRAIANAQALGFNCAFLDVESTFDPVFAASAGVDLDALSMPEHGQNANRLVNIMEVMLRSEAYDVIVLDSIAALLPQSEEGADMEGGNFGTAQAKLMSQALRRLTTANKRTILVYINQTREAIGVMFGKRSITSGGRAMPYYAGVRLELVRTEAIKRKTKSVDHKTQKDVTGDIVKGHRVLVRVEKDKTGGAKQNAETTFVFDYDLGGIDPIEDLIYCGRVAGLIRLTGARWVLAGYEEEAQTSRAKFKSWLRKNVAVQEELEEGIWGAQEAEIEDDEEEVE